jgi:ABC-type spermidine/putrescine transport system permease subunit II
VQQSAPLHQKKHISRTTTFILTVLTYYITIVACGAIGESACVRRREVSFRGAAVCAVGSLLLLPLLLPAVVFVLSALWSTAAAFCCVDVELPCWKILCAQTACATCHTNQTAKPPLSQKKGKRPVVAARHARITTAGWFINTTALTAHTHTASSG